MLRSLRIFIAGIVQPQGRPRAAYRNGRIMVYDPPTSKKWKKEIRRQLPKIEGPPWETPLILTAHFWLPKPKSVKRVECSVKPDLSNCIKAVEDALEGIVFKNDSQIVCLNVSKSYAENNNKAGVLIVVNEIEEDKSCRKTQ